MSDSIFSRTGLMNLFTPASRGQGIVSGKWGTVEGPGWHETEYEGGEPFRWAKRGARLVLAPSPSTWISLNSDIEPGPSLGGNSLRMEVRNEAGECVEVVEAIGRQVVPITVPVDPLSSTILTLHPDGEMRAIPGEPRCLCYRVFSIAQSAPLLSPQLRFESGWYMYESANGQFFRWASNGASIRIHAERANPVLTADLEPGPGTNQRPFRIDLSNQDHERVFTTSIRTRQQIPIRLPMKIGDFGLFHFSGDESMIDPAPGDSRKLVFRTFGITIR